jgi:hypothetical protein
MRCARHTSNLSAAFFADRRDLRNGQALRYFAVNRSTEGLGAAAVGVGTIPSNILDGLAGVVKKYVDEESAGSSAPEATTQEASPPQQSHT